MAHSSGRDGTRFESEKEAWDLSEPMRRMRLKGTPSEGRASVVWTTNQDACVPVAPDFSPRVQNRERAMAAFASVPAPESEPFSPSYHPATTPQPIWTGGGVWAPPRSKEPVPTSSSTSSSTSRTGTSKKEGRASSNQRERGHRQGQERGRRGAVDARLRAEPIWLSARLNELVLGLLPTQEETERKARTIYFLQRIVVGTWPLAKIDIFGSAANSFGVRGSDIDVSVDLPIEEDDRSAKVEVIERLGEILQQVGMEKVIILAHARVPLVKYVDPRTGCASDICINNRVAVANTKLLCDYARIDIRLRQLAFVVKHWAKARQVNETYRGTLSSYAYVLMCIHLLQRKNPPILPCLQGMRPTFSKLLQKGDDLVKCEYFDQVDALRGFGEPNKETLAELLFSFFEYWAWRHDYAHNVVSVRTGGFLTKAEKGWTKRIGNERHLICIEDPFETGHDLGRVVDRNSISALRDEFVRAAKILRDEEDPLSRLFEPYVRPDEHEISEG